MTSSVIEPTAAPQPTGPTSAPAPAPARIGRRRRGFFGDPGILIVLLLTVVAIGGFVLWASITPIAQGITTGGQLSIESRRKTVQHLEGGIIEDILIRDRQQVRAGDVLMVLANADATSRSEQLLNIIISRSFELQRIQSQLRGEQSFAPVPPRGLEGLPQAMLTQAAAIQLKVFEDMKAAADGQIAVLDARKARIDAEIAGNQARLATLRSTMALERREITRLTGLVNQQLTEVSNLTNVQRRLNDALNQESQITSQIAASEAGLLEVEQEKAQVQRQFTADVAAQLSAVNDSLLEAREQFEANQDVLSRREIIAPISGQVLNLAFTTLGGVVSPGEPIMDIVPDDDRLFIEARILPNQIDSVDVGMLVNARFSTLDPVDPPELEAPITTLDTDVTTNPDTGEQFFLARIELPADDPGVMELEASGDFIAGLPVEVFADMNKDRTPLSFLIQPLSDIIERGLRGE